MTDLSHNINGHLTSSYLQYLINPQNIIVVNSDCVEPGLYSEEYDNHINHCVHGFVKFADSQSVFLEALQYNGLRNILVKGGKVHHIIRNWCHANNVTMYNFEKGADYEISRFAPPRHAFIFGIHCDVCVLQHAVAIATESEYIRSVIMLGATHPLYAYTSRSAHLPTIHPRCDALAIKNCEIVK
tara:strand:- start:705 stop:1259 length:555 start_codon:yes stop_codon:yes gene_type:complete